MELEDNGGKRDQVDGGDIPATSRQLPGLEQLDDGVPPLPSAMLADPLEKSNLSKKAEKVELDEEIVDDGKPPVPFSSAEFEDNIEMKILVSKKDECLTNNDNNPVVSNRLEKGTSDDAPHAVEDDGELPPISDSIHNGLEREGARDDAPVVEHDEQEDIIKIPEAVLVEDNDREEVIISGYATPVIPFWKRRSTRLFMCLVFLLATTLAITFGVMFSRNNRPPAPTPTVYTPMPSTSSSPSAPTVSPAPSLSPSSYLDSNKSRKKVVVDNNNMVVVSKDWRHQYSLFVEFFSMSADVGWERVDAFPERGSYYGPEEYDVSILHDGNTTILEFPDDCYGSAIMYEQDISGTWTRETDSRCDPDQSASPNREPGHCASLVTLLGAVLGCLSSL